MALPVVAAPLIGKGALAIGGSILSAIPGILGGIFGKSERNKYADLLMQQNLTMPEGIGRAENIFEKRVGQGLIGKDLIGGELEESFSNIIRTAKTVADSPAALMEALIQGSTSLSEGKRRLGVEDARVKDQSELDLARFLATIVAPAEQRIQEFDINKILTAKSEQMQGTSDLFGGISSGIGAGLSTFGEFQKLDFLKNRSNAMSNFFS